MTPKDKALELYNKYEQLSRDFTRGVSMKEFAKLCALIAVDEILNSNPNYPEFKENEGTTIRYWEIVKQEIEAL
jgi:hypothetical protein